MANGTTETGEETEEGKHHGNTFSVGGSHDGHVLADDEGAASKGDEDLAHYNVADTFIFAAEVDHQAGAQEEEGQTEEKTGVLEVLGVADVDSEEHTPETGSDVVDVEHVPGHCDTKVVDDHQEIGEEQVPAVEGEECQGSHAAGPKHAALLQELVSNKLDTGAPLLPCGKDEKEAKSDHHHGDEGSAVVCG